MKKILFAVIQKCRERFYLAVSDHDEDCAFSPLYADCATLDEARAECVALGISDDKVAVWD